jgi:hypothetical protein
VFSSPRLKPQLAISEHAPIKPIAFLKLVIA